MNSLMINLAGQTVKSSSQRGPWVWQQTKLSMPDLVPSSFPLQPVWATCKGCFGSAVRSPFPVPPSPLQGSFNPLRSNPVSTILRLVVCREGPDVSAAAQAGATRRLSCGDALPGVRPRPRGDAGCRCSGRAPGTAAAGLLRRPSARRPSALPARPTRSRITIAGALRALFPFLVLTERFLPVGWFPIQALSFAAVRHRAWVSQPRTPFVSLVSFLLSL